MAACGAQIKNAVKVVAVAGCGVVIAGCAYHLYKKLRSNQDESADEGFEDSPKVRTANVTVEDQIKPKSQSEVPEKKVLMLGLDGAGKTSILGSLGKQDPQTDIHPTEGFNVMCVQTEMVYLNVWEIGGKASMRDYWKKFLQGTSVLCYVIDTCDHERLEESAKEFKDLLREDELKGVSIIIAANKQDLNGANSLDLIKQIFGQDLCVVPTQVPRKGIHKGIEQLEKMLIEASS